MRSIFIRPRNQKQCHRSPEKSKHLTNRVAPDHNHRPISYDTTHPLASRASTTSQQKNKKRREAFKKSLSRREKVKQKKHTQSLTRGIIPPPKPTSIPSTTLRRTRPENNKLPIQICAEKRQQRDGRKQDIINEGSNYARECGCDDQTDGHF